MFAVRGIRHDDAWPEEPTQVVGETRKCLLDANREAPADSRENYGRVTAVPGERFHMTSGFRIAYVHVPCGTELIQSFGNGECEIMDAAPEDTWPASDTDPPFVCAEDQAEVTLQVSPDAAATVQPNAMEVQSMDALRRWADLTGYIEWMESVLKTPGTRTAQEVVADVSNLYRQKFHRSLATGDVDSVRYWRKVFGFGWVPIPDPESAVVRGRAREVYEEVIDPIRGRAFVQPEQALRLSPPQVVSYVFRTVLYPLHAQPLTAELHAIQEMTGTKLFSRMTLANLGPVGLAMKAFGFEIEDDSTTIADSLGVMQREGAFFAILHQGTSTHLNLAARGDQTFATTDKSAMLMQRYKLAHAGCAFLLSQLREPDRLNSQFPTSETQRKKAESEYVDWVQARRPAPSSSEWISESSWNEGKLLAAYLCVLTGFRRFSRLTDDERTELRRIATDLGQRAAWQTIEEASDTAARFVPRPRSLSSDLGSEVGEGFGAESEVPPVSADRRRELLELAEGIVERARRNPLAWICRAIEDRFVDQYYHDTSDGRALVNAVVRVVATDRKLSEPVLRVSRLELRAKLGITSNGDVNKKSHIVYYDVLCPAEYDLQHNRRHRVSVLAILARIDLFERWRVPSGAGVWVLDDEHTDGQTSRRVERCVQYALACECMGSLSADYDRYSVVELQEMLSGSGLSPGVLLADHFYLMSFLIPAGAGTSESRSLVSVPDRRAAERLAGAREGQRTCHVEVVHGTVTESDEVSGVIEFVADTDRRFANDQPTPDTVIDGNLDRFFLSRDRGSSIPPPTSSIARVLRVLVAEIDDVDEGVI